MSAVELAVKKVRKLSDRQARELLGWLNKQQPNGTTRKRSSSKSGHKRKIHPSMRKHLAWLDSVRLTTNWEPPRMPDDLIKPTEL